MEPNHDQNQFSKPHEIPGFVWTDLSVYQGQVRIALLWRRMKSFKLKGLMARFKL